MTAASEHELRPASHSYFSQRLRLHYCTWGSPAKPPLLLLHGVQDHCRTWDWLVAEFVNDYYVIAPDLRGHGDSQWVRGGGYHHLDYVYDVRQLVATADIAPFTLIGHSMGGTLACLYAGAFPAHVTRLVSIEGIGLWPGRFVDVTPTARVAEWTGTTHALAGREPRRYKTLAAAVARMQKTNPQLSAAQAEHLTVHGSNQNEDGTYSWKFDNYTHSWPPYGVPEADTRALWNSINCPVLLLNADTGYDHRIGHGDSLAEFADARLRVIADAGHWTYHDQLGDVAAAVREFLQGAT